MHQPNGIYQKLIRVFVLQMLFISVITVLGVYTAALIVEKVMIKTALEGEARHYWTWLDQDPQHPTPNTDNLRGYRAKQGELSAVPIELRAMQPGYKRVKIAQAEPLVYVEDRGDTRLFLVFDEDSVGKLSFYFGVVPLSLALMVIYLSAWVAYRLSRRTLSPLVSLAQTMRRFEGNNHNFAALNLAEYTAVGVNDEVRILAQSLQEFTTRLQQQLIREREFTRDVSHELRTPLAVISGSLELLQKQASSPVQQRAVERMQVTTRDMQALIATLLLLAREESQHIPLAAVSVNELVEQLMTQVEQTHNSAQRLKLLRIERQHLTINAPSQALAIVLGNLMRNACNYTHQGSVTVLIEGNAVEIRDTGLGMSAEQLELAQQVFQRVHTTSDGYGLGLDIVRRLCERYGWQLTIRSLLSQGTTVRVQLVS
ncbi:Signal transduction histidine kinase [Thiothrix eikelboomii]|uniref:histidine kinase n=1 Tax=Thiothrix eikelboomii TaxID=92487 RepID=A0A1T4XDM8_9GAMM|nr:HAMP domain-containing sensor histidine kinase [Thiothrix eikelboomii]SKA87101.1 Signal transduction histidine kinase [Thiothrix eikelboomii]